MEDLWSERHSVSPRCVRSSAPPLRNGAKTEELVGPMGKGGGHQDLRLRSRARLTETFEGGEGPGSAPGVAPGEDHCIVNGPEGDGMVIAVPPGMALVGRSWTSSEKICKCVDGGGPMRSKIRQSDPGTERSCTRCTLLKSTETRRSEENISSSGPPSAPVDQG